MADRFSVPVTEAGLSARSTNALVRGGYYSMDDVCKAAPYELLRLPEFGRKSLNELAEWARANGGLAAEDRRMAERQLTALRDRAAIIARDIAALESRLANG